MSRNTGCRQKLSTYLERVLIFLSKKDFTAWGMASTQRNQAFSEENVVAAETGSGKSGFWCKFQRNEIKYIIFIYIRLACPN